MLTQSLSANTPDSIEPTARPRMWAITAVSIVGLVAVALSAREGAVADRIRNPEVSGSPRPVEPLWGFDHWLAVHQIATLLTMVGVVGFVIYMWRRRPRHPILLMAIALTTLIWLDPITNWAPYGVYNPQLWHLPEDWPLASIAPTVQPFVVLGYATFYIGPFLIARRILDRLQADRPDTSFVRRHPLVTIALIVLPIGFLQDAVLEITLIRSQLYIYSQAPSFGTYAAGRWYQFPILWVSTLINLVMVPVAVLLSKDGDGRTQAEKVAQRFRVFSTRPAVGAFVVMWSVVTFCHAGYAGVFAVTRHLDMNDSLACPYPFEEAKVYDPNALYEASGQPGPYFPGIWAGLPTGQPHGRPDPANVTPAESCA